MEASTEQLETEFTQLSQRRVSVEEAVKQFRLGLGTEQTRVHDILNGLQEYLRSAEEGKAFQQLGVLVNAEKLMVELHAQLERLRESLSVISESETQALASRLDDILTSQLRSEDVIQTLVKKLSATADKENRALDLIISELQKGD